ncbi:hypothetical protein GO986_20700 [Deinococcus sp. HMF7620]|uniref:Uncharacterized protein n=1 Tax=Deinococcus arboris TaxID=2682977 RepID=A0A7C9MBK5_9DEIO|nr:hypothetical protein [Deinococcus arboris]MVN89159.1 hypothetical protein [Deinococcus arboris]
MSSRPAPALSAAEHLRQLRKIYGPLSPAFVADELACTLEQAVQHLYGSAAAQHCWVRLGDVASLAGVSAFEVRQWVHRAHLPLLIRGAQPRPAAALLHLADAALLLQDLSWPFAHPTWAFLPRWPVPSHKRGAPAEPVQTTELDWQLARQAAWPMTVERLADAVYGTQRSDRVQQTRRLIRHWEKQGRITCFAKGLYDLVRPALILDPALYGRGVLPKVSTQALRDHHPEVRHWPSFPLAAAWRAYSRFYGSALLPVLARREPTFLEYLTVRQLDPAIDLQLNAQYEVLCQETAFYRLDTAPLVSSADSMTIEVTAENVQAGLVDFKALVAATRQKLQRDFERSQTAAQPQC